MAPDKLRPSDPRATHHTADIRGKTYHYILSEPVGAYQATVLLVHGWPDLHLGWRYVVPYLTTLGLRVVVPDMVGYGGTDAPEPLEAYSLKSVAADLAALAELTAPGEQVVLGGHDWGGLAVWRAAQWHPGLVRAVFSVCTPYFPPSQTYVDLNTQAAVLPNFTYQIQLAGPDVEREVAGEARLRSFIHGFFGGRGPAGELVFENTRGVLLENLDKLGKSPLIDDEEAEFYVREYSRHGCMHLCPSVLPSPGEFWESQTRAPLPLQHKASANPGGAVRGPLNWYRTRKVNFDEERALLADGGPPRFAMPALMLSASGDSTLPPRLTEGMDRHFDDLTRAVIPGNHWVLLGPWAEAANAEIGKFLKRVLADDKTPKASI